MKHPALHIVAADQPQSPRVRRAIAPETKLRRLFRREAAIEVELIANRAHQHRARQEYAAKHGLLMLPGFGTLRRLFR